MKLSDRSNLNLFIQSPTEELMPFRDIANEVIDRDPIVVAREDLDRVRRLAELEANLGKLASGARKSRTAAAGSNVCAPSVIFQYHSFSITKPARVRSTGTK